MPASVGGHGLPTAARTSMPQLEGICRRCRNGRLEERRVVLGTANQRPPRTLRHLCNWLAQLDRHPPAVNHLVHALGRLEPVGMPPRRHALGRLESVGMMPPRRRRLRLGGILRGRRGSPGCTQPAASCNVAMVADGQWVHSSPTCGTLWGPRGCRQPEPVRATVRVGGRDAGPWLVADQRISP